MKHIDIILASASPRRRDLLLQAGLQFQVKPSGIEENLSADEPHELVIALAQSKSRDIAAREDGPAVIIGADTIVVSEGICLGKPTDKADAFRMLKILSGKTHQVMTGVCLIASDGGKTMEKLFYESTDVTMYEISDDDAYWYIDTKEPLDKAGSYGIQGLGSILVQKINGDYANVVGLPIARVFREYRELVKNFWCD